MSSPRFGRRTSLSAVNEGSDQETTRKSWVDFRVGFDRDYYRNMLETERFDIGDQEQYDPEDIKNYIISAMNRAST